MAGGFPTKPSSRYWAILSLKDDRREDALARYLDDDGIALMAALVVVGMQDRLVLIPNDGRLLGCF